MEEGEEVKEVLEMASGLGVKRTLTAPEMPSPARQTPPADWGWIWMIRWDGCRWFEQIEEEDEEKMGRRDLRVCEDLYM